MIHLLDVSKWQREVNWTLVAANGIDGAITKASEGVGYRDPTFRRNWQGIHDAGLIRGAYHFARPSAPNGTMAEYLTDAEKEAKWFAFVVSKLGEGDLPPVVDVEWNKRHAHVKAAQWVPWTRRFLEVIEAELGRVPMIYSGPSFWRYKLAKTLEFNRYPLWLANYTGADPQNPDAPKRRTPKRPIPGWPTTIWQWTGKGSCAGIGGRVDRNLFMGTQEELERLASIPTHTVPPDIEAPTSPTIQPPDVIATPPPPEPEDVPDVMGWDAVMDFMLSHFLGRRPARSHCDPSNPTDPVKPR